jgi:hypothetical protein
MTNNAFSYALIPSQISIRCMTLLTQDYPWGHQVIPGFPRILRPQTGAGAIAACTVLRMRTTIIKSMFMACTLGLAFAACATTPVEDPDPEDSSSTEQYVVSCTPGAETCDYGCGFDGSEWNSPTPTSDDCIIRCNAAGNGWNLVSECGWAQNFPYSSSCLNSQPHPVCQNN